MVLHILAVVSQWERETIGERTAEAMAYKRRQREYTGGEPPYGWQLAADGVHLDPHVDEQAIIREALELKAAGLSMRKIGAQLAARDLLPRQGKMWNPKMVRDLLQAEVA
jgi:DNA invertase Pin-like site-specific DNA recombinase